MVATLQYPPPLDAARDSTNIAPEHEAPVDIETPILIVGGGPVGMLQALIFARIHKRPCTLIEREMTTTPFPKMEYTNGRSMEVYRLLGLHDELRKVGTAEVPEHHNNDELIVTSLVEGGKLIYTWEHDGAMETRKKSREYNDGSSYLEPPLRCHQIIIERWLKEKVKAESLIDSHWGTAFLGLLEADGSVITQVRKASGEDLRIKSQFVIGTDGGGSWVRKSAQLESKRRYLDLTAAFVHFRSTSLRQLMPFPRAWHYNVIGGGILVSQNEDDLWTCHFMLPPGMDATTLSAEQILALSIGGCQGAVPVPVDEIYCQGVWRTDVAIANRFHSTGGRVLLAGDAAHQLSPIGGHGLNSGIGDVFDLAWKVAAVLDGWAGKELLPSYNTERRQIAFENLDHVQEGLNTIVVPIFASHLKYGAEVVNGDGPDADKARAEVLEFCKRGHWLHNQTGNILGTSYKDSPVIMQQQETGERPVGTNEHYIPSTFPGSRAPHVYMADGQSTLDALSPTCFNLVDFSTEASSSQSFVAAAESMHLPLKILRWVYHKEAHVRKVYERDLVLVRPDGYVAWRSPESPALPLSKQDAAEVLRFVSGHALSKHSS